MRFDLGTYILGIASGLGLIIGGTILLMLNSEREDAARPIRNANRFRDFNLDPASWEGSN
jgi:hypothetical protein